MSKKFAVLNGKSMTVYDTERGFFDNIEMIKGDETVALEVVRDGNKYLLPIRDTNGTSVERPGVYLTDNHFAFLSYPTTKLEKSQYAISEDNIFDFTNVKSMQEVIDKKEQMDYTLNKYLETDPNDPSITKPPIGPTDTPHMKAIKTGIAEKNCSISKYEERFGSSYQNDIRKLQEDDITIKLMKRIGNNLDMKIDIVITDANPDVPNPMRKKITANIVPGEDDILIEDI